MMAAESKDFSKPEKQTSLWHFITDNRDLLLHLLNILDDKDILRLRGTSKITRVVIDNILTGKNIGIESKIQEALVKRDLFFKSKSLSAESYQRKFEADYKLTIPSFKNILLTIDNFLAGVEQEIPENDPYIKIKSLKKAIADTPPGNYYTTWEKIRPNYTFSLIFIIST